MPVLRFCSWTGTYANGVQAQSPASRSARWVSRQRTVQTPTGFYLPKCETLLGFEVTVISRTQGALRDPWALVFNRFAVRKT